MTILEDAPRDPVDELGILLARYADSVLRPDPFAMDRMRAQLRAQAQRASVHRRAESLAAAARPVAEHARPWRPFTAWSMRRLSFATAASLVLGLSIGATTFAASRAGGGLYETRVWIETALLPREAGPRLEAELALALVRLGEAADAAAHADGPAVTAALDAYNAMVTRAADEHPAGSPGNATALAAIAGHLDILAKLALTAPAAAGDALAHAAEASRHSIDVLNGNTGRPTDPGQPGQPGDPPGQGGGVGGPAATDKPTKTPKPAKTPVPAATPRATPSHGPGSGGGSGGGQGGGTGSGNGGGSGSSPPESHGPPDAAGGQGGDAPGNEKTPKP